MSGKLSYLLRSGKNSKQKYFAINYLRQLIPEFIFRKRLESVLNSHCRRLSDGSWLLTDSRVWRSRHRDSNPNGNPAETNGEIHMCQNNTPSACAVWHGPWQAETPEEAPPDTGVCYSSPHAILYSLCHHAASNNCFDRLSAISKKPLFLT